MGVFGGLGGIIWVLPTGAAFLAGPGGHSAPQASLHAPAPFTLSLFAAETAPMSVRDRFRIARGRNGMLAIDWGRYSVTMTAGRTRGGRQSFRRGERVNLLVTYQLGAAVRADLPGGLTMGGSGGVTYVSRRLVLPGSDGRQRHSLIANADLSIARGPDDRLSLSYLDVASGGGRSTLARAIELAAGAPRAAGGFRLAYSHRIASDGVRSLTWGIDMSTMRLSERDSLLLGEPVRATDRRIAMELDRRF